MQSISRVKRACKAYICFWKDEQLQQIVDKTILEADQDGDGKLSFEEFAQMVSNTVRRSSFCLLRLPLKSGVGHPGHREANDTGRPFLVFDHAAMIHSFCISYHTRKITHIIIASFSCSFTMFQPHLSLPCYVYFHLYQILSELSSLNNVSWYYNNE